MRLGKAGSVIAFGVLGLVVLALVTAAVYLAVRSARIRARRAEARRIERDTPWTMFSRPNLTDGGRTWRVGVERRSDDDRLLSDPVYVTDSPIPRDDDRARVEAEGVAIRWAAEYTEARAR